MLMGAVTITRITGPQQSSLLGAWHCLRRDLRQGCRVPPSPLLASHFPQPGHHLSRDLHGPREQSLEGGNDWSDYSYRPMRTGALIPPYVPNPIYAALPLRLRLAGDSSPDGRVSTGSVYSLVRPNPPSLQIPQTPSLNLPELTTKSSKTFLEHPFHLPDLTETWEQKPAVVPRFDKPWRWLAPLLTSPLSVLTPANPRQQTNQTKQQQQISFADVHQTIAVPCWYHRYIPSHC